MDPELNPVIHSTLHHFAITTGNLEDHDDEVLEARWIALADAQEALTYPGERDMVARALAIQGQDR